MKTRVNSFRDIGLYLTLATLFMIPNQALAISTPVQSTFDSNLEVWTVTGSGTVSHSASGGNPGGFIQYNDQTAGDGFIIAPNKFLGDWSNLDNGNGKLSWDHKIIVEGNPVDPNDPLKAVISGPGGTAEFNSGIAPSTTNWLTVMATIDESLWSVTSGTWNGLLSDVTDLRLLIEVVSNGPGLGEVDGIDNVVLSSSAIPEPSTMLLFGTGFIGLIGWRKLKGYKTE